ncbi:MAG: hypothetical protein M3Z75_28655 [Actinomycetota bacterium]|nr:hypothetical protein [Actinomycetota bacterium]
MRWRLGDKYSSFAMGYGAPFWWQHRRLDRYGIGRRGKPLFAWAAGITSLI